MAYIIHITSSKRLPQLLALIRAEHQASAVAMQRGLQHAMAAGDRLIEAKRLAGHGNWLLWLRGNYWMSVDTAHIYMRIAKSRGIIEADPKRFEGLNILQVYRVCTRGRWTMRHVDADAG